MQFQKGNRFGKRFKTGQSGNPSGISKEQVKHRGGLREVLLYLLSQDSGQGGYQWLQLMLSRIIQKAAIYGDMTAARLVIEYALDYLKQRSRVR